MLDCGGTEALREVAWKINPGRDDGTLVLRRSRIGAACALRRRANGGWREMPRGPIGAHMEPDGRSTDARMKFD